MQTSNKEKAIDFLNMVTKNNISAAFETNIAPGFTHHNPYFAGDARGLAHGMEENAKQFPHKEFHIQHVLVDGEYVAVHARLQLSAAGPVIATLHLFRFEDGKIVELWDIGQAMPAEKVNERELF